MAGKQDRKEEGALREQQSRFAFGNISDGEESIPDFGAVKRTESCDQTIYKPDATPHRKRCLTGCSR